MINRILIRTKVVQMMYSFYVKGDGNLVVSEKELLFSLDKSYELYFSLLQIMVDLTRLMELKQEAAKGKFLPTDNELNPNTRLVNNRFIAVLRQNEAFESFITKHAVDWADDSEYLRRLLAQIVDSEIYHNYTNNPIDDFAIDREFWRSVMKNIIFENEELTDQLEEKSLYWVDDFDIISSFVMKTIKKISDIPENNSFILPMYKDNEDAQFAIDLFRAAIVNATEYRAMIAENSKNWELERIALIDTLVMQAAIAELFTFDSIPVVVTLNEYIELAKAYGSNKSGLFINGILDTIITNLKKEGKLTK